MRRLHGFALALTLTFPVAVVVVEPAVPTSAAFDAETSGLQCVALQRAAPALRFEPNLGQFTDDVRFVARARHGSILVEDTVLVFASGGARVRMTAVGANARAIDEPDGLLPGVTNYLLGGDPDHWTTGIPSYARVTKRGLYDGVDLVLRESSGRFEYDFAIAPGTDPSCIALRFDGAEAVEVLDDGALSLVTSKGTIRHAPPVAYQDINGERHSVASRFVWRAEGTAGFAVAGFDPATPLVIDPIVEFSLDFGGSADDTLTDMKTTGDGGVVIAGWSESYDIPLAHPIQTDPNESSIDSFVTRLDATGSSLVFSTYLGGRSADDRIKRIALDDSEYVYVAGMTRSIDYPLVSPIRTVAEGIEEGFVTALAPDGASMIYSTYLGGRGFDACSAISVDAAGRATVAGYTSSRDFPKVKALELRRGSAADDETDAFVATIGPRGTALELATVFGGAYEEFATHLVVWDGGIAVAGTTDSRDFPLVNAFASTHAGQEDAFVVSFVPGEPKPVFSTYLGGDGSDVPVGLMRADTGEFVVVGATGSSDFPTTAGQDVDEDLYFGDVFVTRFRSTGSIVLSTYFGSPSYHDYPGEAAMATDGTIYVTGLTQSLDFPQLNPIQPRPEPGFLAVGFLSQLTGDGDGVLMSSYLTGYGTGGGFSLDESGNMWIAEYADIEGLDIRNPFDVPEHSRDLTISRLVRSSTLLGLQVESADSVGQGMLVTVPVTVTNTGPGTAGDLSVRIHIAEGGRLVFARDAIETLSIRDGANAGDSIVRLPALGAAQQRVVELGILVNSTPAAKLRMTARLLSTAWLNGRPFPIANVEADVVPQSVTPPILLNAKPMGDGAKFRVRLTGSGFEPAAQISVGADPTPWPSVKRKGAGVLILRGGTSLLARFPVGVQVPIRVVNPDGGEATTLVVR